MIDRLRQLSDLARTVFAVPHLIAEQAALELRVDELQQRLDDVAAIVNEIYVGPRLARRPTEVGSRNGTPASGSDR